MATNTGFKNVGIFENIINETKTIVITMKVGTIFTYSAYMMTHQLQVKKESVGNEPLIIVVSYNSKSLFSNMMKSFHRDILTKNI